MYRARFYVRYLLVHTVYPLLMLTNSLRKMLAGMAQMTSVNDVAVNFATCASIVSDAAAKGCKIVFFPECVLEESSSTSAHAFALSLQ